MLLNEAKIRAAKPKNKPYKLSDGLGMYLQVQPNGSKYWRLSYRFDGKQKTLTLGVYPEIRLAVARANRTEARELIAEGIDPNAQRKQETFERRYGTTFEDMARAWHTANQSWIPEHKESIIRSLERYVFPVIGSINIKEVEIQDLLIPVRNVNNLGFNETAKKIQQRINAIMRFAVQNGIIKYNPAQDMLGSISSARVTHRPALELYRLPDLQQRIAEYRGRQLTKYAVMLSIQLFIRTSELRFGRWDEVDFENATWTIPAERKPIEGVRFSNRGSKMKTPHLVPLSKQSLMIMRSIYSLTGEQELIFANTHNRNKPLSENTINKALQTMGYDTKTEVCGHGFRAMACSALVESGLWSVDAIERQMSHQERNSVRAAYIHKAEHLEERRKMMQWWSDYLDACRKTAINPYEFAKLAA